MSECKSPGLCHACETPPASTRFLFLTLLPRDFVVPVWTPSAPFFPTSSQTTNQRRGDLGLKLNTSLVPTLRVSNVKNPGREVQGHRVRKHFQSFSTTSHRVTAYHNPPGHPFPLPPPSSGLHALHSRPQACGSEEHHHSYFSSPRQLS